ncbi:hypothetical protein Tco_0567772 [Tanacetum coccineum]
MASYNRILSKDWLNPKPVIRRSLQWYQSQRFKPWEKPIRNRLEDYEMRYSLKNGTTDIVPKSSQRKKLSHEGKTMLKENLKESEAFNSSSCPNKRNKNRGQDALQKQRDTFMMEGLNYPERVHVKTDYMVEGSDKQNWDKIWDVRHRRDEKKVNIFLWSGEASLEKQRMENLGPQYHTHVLTLYAGNHFECLLAYGSMGKSGNLRKCVGKKFMEMLEWFYLGYLGQDVLGDLPPVIGVIKIAKLLGLAQENQEAVKECYKEYIGMVKVYYEEAQKIVKHEGGR